MPPPPPALTTAAPTATATADLARPPQLVDPYEARVPDAHLRSLQTAVTELSRPLPPRRIAAVVAQAATEALNPQAVVVAFHEDDGLDLRSAHVAGLPYLARRRICARPVPAPDLVGEIERFLSSAGPGPSHAVLAALPIAQGERTLGLVVLGRPSSLPLSQDERTFLSVLTSLCALAMERLRMYADHSRVGAALRRHPSDLEQTGGQLRVGDLEIDLDERRAKIGSDAVALTPCEMRLLVFLATPPGRPRGRREILQRLWHLEHVGDERACDVYIANLRRKLERDPGRPERLIVDGHGYALAPG